MIERWQRVVTLVRLRHVCQCEGVENAKVVSDERGCVESGTALMKHRIGELDRFAQFSIAG